MNNVSIASKQYNPQTRDKFQDSANPFRVDVINVWSQDEFYKHRYIKCMGIPDFLVTPRFTKNFEKIKKNIVLISSFFDEFPKFCQR